MAIKVDLVDVRASYVHVLAPKKDISGKEKYSVQILIPKESQEGEKAHKAVERALEEGKSKAFGGKIPKVWRSPIHDGDGVKANGEAYSEECKGCWVINASSTDRPPVLIGRNMTEVTPANAEIYGGEIYSGVWCVVGVAFSAYSVNGNSGVGCYLNSLWKIRDGEQLGGGKTSGAGLKKDLQKYVSLINWDEASEAEVAQAFEELDC